jgi:hypothetical protein
MGITVFGYNTGFPSGHRVRAAGGGDRRFAGGTTQESRRVTRIAALIWLTLTAATLPAASHPVYAADSGRPDRCETPSAPACPSSDRAPARDSQPQAAWVRPTLDVWDGSLARASVDPAPRLFITLPATTAIPDGHTAAGPWRSRTETRGATDPSQHRWMACRYAHAPPVSC